MHGFREKSEVRDACGAVNADGGPHKLSPGNDLGPRSGRPRGGIVRMLSNRQGAFLTPPPTAVPGHNKSRIDQTEKD